MPFGSPGDCPLEPDPGGADVARIALRTDARPHDADAQVTVSVDGVVVGGSLVSRAAEFEPAPGGGYVLRDFRLLFTAAPCCFACREADVDVAMNDAEGGAWSGSARVRFSRGYCPECCTGGEACDLAPPAAGCPRLLEIGDLGDAGEFRAWRDGQHVGFVVNGGQGVSMIQPMLRASGVDPREPDPEVEVSLAGHVVAAELAGERTDMQPDGAGAYVLPPLTVPFTVETCCFVCRDVYVSAWLLDGAGGMFARALRVGLSPGQCPQPAFCCRDASVCPDPSLAPVCE